MNDSSELRDHFATPIMAAAMSQANGLGELPPDKRKQMLLQVAHICYEAADAMMEARKQ